MAGQKHAALKNDRTAKTPKEARTIIEPQRRREKQIQELKYLTERTTGYQMLLSFCSVDSLCASAVRND
jgi:hypothetical protein